MSIANHPPFINIQAIEVQIWENKKPRTVIIKAATLSRTLLALVLAGESGITALEMGSWAFRLSAYVHRLKKDYGLDIKTEKESHLNGWHARYILQTPVDILDVETN